MFARKSLVVVLTALVLMVQAAAAQPEARIQFVQPGVDQLKGDLKYLVELSPTVGLKKQWEGSLKPLIDSFAEGLDSSKPLRVDVVVGKDINYEMHFPIQKLEGKGGFLENLNGMGFTVKKVGGNLYSIVQGDKKKGAAKKPMFMRHLNGYVSIAPNESEVPANLAAPFADPAVQALLAKGYDVVGSLKNTATAKDIAARKASFQELRKQLEAGLVFKRNEDKNEFALRKLSLTQNLNEAERFVVEADEFLFGWTTTAAPANMEGKGRAEFHITALPNTDLAKSTEKLVSKSSYFANVKLSEKGEVSGKVNFAIDSLRAAHLKDFYEASRPVMEAQIDLRPTIKEAAQKKAAKEAGGILIDLLIDSIKLEVADLFMDLHSAGDGKHTFVCGAHVSNGKKADGIVKLLPNVTSREVKLDIQKIGDDVSVHSVQVPDHRLEAFHKLFPGENLIYVATSKDAVWGAAGVNAVQELTTAIGQVAGAAPEQVDPRIVHFTANSARLIELIDILKPEAVQIDPKLSKDEQSRIKQRQKDVERIRKLAIEATAKCNPVFSGEVKKNGNKVEGWMDVSECVLRFIGAVTADIAKDLQ